MSNPHLDFVSEDQYHQKNAPKYKKVRDFYQGQDAIKEAQTEYLPMEQKEDPDEYSARLARTYMIEAFQQQLDLVIGLTFRKELSVSAKSGDGEVSPKFKEYCANIDLEGNNLNSFAKKVFRAGMKDGIAYILVDMPPGAAPGATLDEENKLGLRPYWRLVEADNLIFLFAQTENGAKYLAEIRIRECEEKLQGGKILKFDRVRVLQRFGNTITWKLYESPEKENNWQMIKEGQFSGIAAIPLVPFYTKQCGFYRSDMPMMGLANLNLAHYQSNSDQQNILHVCRVPFLLATGFTEKDPIVVGVSRLTRNSDVSANLRWVEHTGAAIGAGKEALQELEAKMDTFGLRLLTKPGTQTATEKSIDTAQGTSSLGEICISFDNTLAAAIEITESWDKQEYNAAATVNKDFGVSSDDAATIITLRTNGELSRQAMFAELKRRGVIMGSYDEVKDKDLIDAEAQSQVTEALA